MCDAKINFRNVADIPAEGIVCWEISCGRTFAKVGDFERHIENEHGRCENMTFQCHVCDKEYISAGGHINNYPARQYILKHLQNHRAQKGKTVDAQDFETRLPWKAYK
jgi:hypothetical protein